MISADGAIEQVRASGLRCDCLKREYIIIYNPRKGEIVRYYGSYKETERRELCTHILVSCLALVCCVFFDVLYLAYVRVELSWADLCCVVVEEGLCDFHDTGFDLPHARRHGLWMKSRKKDSNSSERTLASVECTSKCRTLSRRFNVCCINVYNGVYYTCTCEWNIAPLYILYLSLSVSLLFFFYSQGGGWPLLPKKGGSVLRRLHYFLLLSSIL